MRGARVARRPQDQRERDDHGELDREVDPARDEARADAGQRQLDLDALGRRDRQPVLERDRCGAADVVGAHTPSRRWTPIASRASAKRAGTSSPRSCARPARGPSGWAPRRCCGSAGATAPPPPTSRSRAGCSPATRSRGGSSGWSPRRARASTRPSRGAARCARFLATGYWQRVLERPLMLGLGARAAVRADGAGRRLGGRRPGGGARHRPRRVPGRGRAGLPHRRTSRPARRPRSPARSTRTTSA